MIFQISGVNKQYDDDIILEDVNLDIRGGEIHGIVGYNGAGKSTMAKIIAGIAQMDSGKIALDHMEQKNWSIRKAMRTGVFYADCRSTLLPELTVLENMLYGLNNIRGNRLFGILLNQRRIERELTAAIDRFQLECAPDSKVAELSTSLKSTLELLRIRMFHPKVLLIDELDSNVNEKYLDIMETMIGEMKGDGTGILYISHQVDKVLQVSDRVSVLMDAHVVETFEREQFQSEGAFDRMFRMMSERLPKTVITPQAKILEFEQVSNSKIRDFSMYVREGEIVGILGLEKEGPASIEEILFHGLHHGKTLYREKK